MGHSLSTNNRDTQNSSHRNNAQESPNNTSTPNRESPAIDNHGPIRSNREGSSPAGIHSILTRRVSSSRVRNVVYRLRNTAESSSNNSRVLRLLNSTLSTDTELLTPDDSVFDLTPTTQQQTNGSAHRIARFLQAFDDDQNSSAARNALPIRNRNRDWLFSGSRLSRSISGRNPMLERSSHNMVPELEASLISAAIEAIGRTVADFRNTSPTIDGRAPNHVDTSLQEQFANELSTNLTQTQAAQFATMPISYVHNNESYRFYRRVETQSNMQQTVVPILIVRVGSVFGLDIPNMYIPVDELRQEAANSPASLQSSSVHNNSTTSASSGQSQSSFVSPPENDESRPPRRSWIVHMYVSLVNSDDPILNSSNHESYEELLRLSGIIGQAKPPTTTIDKITKNLQTITYNKKDKRVLNMKDVETCSVCLLNYKKLDKLRILKCLHGFHKDCIDVWLTKGNNNCPVCRSIPFEDNPVQTHDSEKISPS